MRSLGVREIKASMTRVMQEIEESGEEVEVLQNGVPAARIVPARRKMTAAEIAAWNARVDALAARISRMWTGPTDAGEIMRSERDR